jgi:hypothetical protein
MGRVANRQNQALEMKFGEFAILTPVIPINMTQNTTGLIKGWSVVIGVLSLASLFTLAEYPVASITWILSLLALIFGLAVAYVGLQVNSLSTKTVGGIFWTKLVLLIINFVLSVLVAGMHPVRLLIIVVEAVIVGFLIHWLKKLPKQTSASAA